MSDGISNKQYVGVDPHLHRSVIVRSMSAVSSWIACRSTTTPLALAREVRKAGRGAQVAIEATYGWYWAVDAAQLRSSRCTGRIRTR